MNIKISFWYIIYFENGNRYILTKLFDHYELMPEEANRKNFTLKRRKNNGKGIH